MLLSVTYTQTDRILQQTKSYTHWLAFVIRIALILLEVRICASILLLHETDKFLCLSEGIKSVILYCSYDYHVASNCHINFMYTYRQSCLVALN